MQFYWPSRALALRQLKHLSIWVHLCIDVFGDSSNKSISDPSKLVGLRKPAKRNTYIQPPSLFGPGPVILRGGYTPPKFHIAPKCWLGRRFPLFFFGKVNFQGGHLVAFPLRARSWPDQSLSEAREQLRSYLEDGLPGWT